MALSIPGNGGPGPKSRLIPASRTAPTMKMIIFPAAELKDINRLITRIGPFTLRQWSELLVKSFNETRAAEPNTAFRIAFKIPEDIFRVDANSKNYEDKVMAGLAMQFLAQFNSDIAKELNRPPKETLPLMHNFITLKGLAYRLAEAEKKGLSPEALAVEKLRQIQKANESFEMCSRSYDLPFLIIIR